MPNFSQIGHGLSHIEWDMSNMSASCHTSMQASYVRFWKEKKRVKKVGKKSVRTLDDCKWRAAAPGLKFFLYASGSTQQPKYLGCPRAPPNNLSNPSWCSPIVFFFLVWRHTARAPWWFVWRNFLPHPRFFWKRTRCWWKSLPPRARSCDVSVTCDDLVVFYKLFWNWFGVVRFVFH